MTQPWKEASITLGSRRQGGRDSVTEREASGIKYSVCSCPGFGALYYKRTLSPERGKRQDSGEIEREHQIIQGYNGRD